MEKHTFTVAFCCRPEHVEDVLAALRIALDEEAWHVPEDIGCGEINLELGEAERVL